MLTAERIELELGNNRVLAGVSVAVHSGELVGLIGPNGAGKSSLLRVMVGIQTAAAGAVHWEGRPLAGRATRELARQLAYLPQQEIPAWPLLVEHLVELGRAPWRRPWGQLRKEDRIAVEQALAMTELEALRHRSVGQLSGGELRRALLARVFAGKPRCILADEPIAALDPYHQLHVMELLQRHAQEGGGVIAALHDLGLAARFCNRLVLLHRGHMVIEGTPAEVLRAEFLESVYGVRAHIECNAQGVAVMPYERLRLKAVD